MFGVEHLHCSSKPSVLQFPLCSIPPAHGSRPPSGSPESLSGPAGRVDWAGLGRVCSGQVWLCSRSARAARQGDPGPPGCIWAESVRGAWSQGPAAPAPGTPRVGWSSPAAPENWGSRVPGSGTRGPVVARGGTRGWVCPFPHAGLTAREERLEAGTLFPKMGFVCGWFGLSKCNFVAGARIGRPGLLQREEWILSASSRRGWQDWGFPQVLGRRQDWHRTGSQAHSDAPGSPPRPPPPTRLFGALWCEVWGWDPSGAQQKTFPFPSPVPFVFLGQGGGAAWAATPSPLPGSLRLVPSEDRRACTLRPDGGGPLWAPAAARPMPGGRRCPPSTGIGAPPPSARLHPLPPAPSPDSSVRGGRPSPGMGRETAAAHGGRDSRWRPRPRRLLRPPPEAPDVPTAPGVRPGLQTGRGDPTPGPGAQDRWGEGKGAAASGEVGGRPPQPKPGTSSAPCPPLRCSLQS